MNRQRPEYGQPFRGIPPDVEDKINEILERVNQLFRGVTDVGITFKAIAGLSITEILDELVVSAAEIIDSDTIGVTVAPRPTAQAGARYIVSVRLDGVEQPLQLISFTPTQIQDREPRNLQFVGSIAGVSVITVEVSIDSSVAVLTLADVDVGIGASPNSPLRMDTGDKGLAGFDITATIVDPSILIFTNVTCPFPLAITDVSPDGSSASVSCVDLGGVVGPNEIGVLIADFILSTLAVGNTDIILTITALDDDDGFIIRRVISNALVTVS